jgi:glycine cleavage system H protein
MNIPENLKYTKEHEWVKIDGTLATVGITDHAQSSLGDIVFLELPAIGKELKQGETFGVAESIKAVSDLYSPLSGKVSETNTELTDNPGNLNNDPYKNWLIKIEVTSDSKHESLINASEYEKFVSSL